MSSLFIPLSNVVSLTLPDGALDVFASAWRLDIAGNNEVATVILNTGVRIEATFGTDNAVRRVWGNRDGIWMQAPVSQQLHPPVSAVAVPGGGLPI